MNAAGWVDAVMSGECCERVAVSGGAVACKGGGGLQTASGKRKVLYGPTSLREMCLKVIGKNPQGCLLRGTSCVDEAVFGEELVGEMVFYIVKEGTLTIPLVKYFNSIARDSEYELLTTFLGSLDIFAATGLRSNG
mmetsp:Transcript_5181/g.7907  ORF Transcript_5181/g.7907 Transcript_5181/m.7907 type:complete len:136 (+) Transcript_5181:110-517(+)